MDAVLERDVEVLKKALAGDGQTLNIRLSRKAAEIAARAVSASANGGQVITTKGDTGLSPNEVAGILGISRPQVRKLMDKGLLPFSMVGSHHRINPEDVTAYLQAERIRRSKVRSRYAELQNELGLL
jgi:excisionase family DNA binding protein